MSDSNPVMLDVKGLNKSFGSVHAVQDLSFQVRKGEVFGFLGPNGAGKTTTMRIITCFIPATSGTVAVDGMSTDDRDLEVRRRIGYLPESAPLYNDMLVNEYLRFVGEIRGITGQKLASRLEEMYQICGLTTMTHRQVGNLSKGYRQRVGLAQAMLHDPDLLILDEPMSGLDPNQIIEIRQLIKRIGAEKTVIYCSHILSEVSATCNRILIINNGVIVATGTPDELASQAKQGSHYRMTVRADRQSLETTLPALEGVASVTVHDAGNGWHAVQVVPDTKEHIGERLFSCAVRNGWTLRELSLATVSLEDIFMQLTRG